MPHFRYNYLSTTQGQNIMTNKDKKILREYAILIHTMNATPARYAVARNQNTTPEHITTLLRRQ